MALAYYDVMDVGAGNFDQPATSRFCAFSRSENRTKVELNQHCIDSMTSLRYISVHARWPIHSPFFEWVGAHPNYESYQGHKIQYC